MKQEYINFKCKIPISKLSDVVRKEEDFRFHVDKKAEDRIKKLDAHAIWSIALNFSSRHVSEEGMNVLSGIGHYYSLFHCVFSIVCLDVDIPDNCLHKVSHDQLTNFLKREVKLGVASKDLWVLFTDARFVREFVNYLSGESGHDKFMSLRHTPRSLITDSFGKIQFNDFVGELDSRNSIVIDEFMKMLRNIEDHFSTSIFPILHRNAYYDYYGEDFLENFFDPSCGVVSQIEQYLSKIENL